MSKSNLMTRIFTASSAPVVNAPVVKTVVRNDKGESRPTLESLQAELKAARELNAKLKNGSTKAKPKSSTREDGIYPAPLLSGQEKVTHVVLHIAGQTNSFKGYWVSRRDLNLINGYYSQLDQALKNIGE